MIRAWLAKRREVRAERERERGFGYACTSVLMRGHPVYYIADVSRNAMDFSDFDRGVLQATQILASLTGDPEDIDHVDHF